MGNKLEFCLIYRTQRKKTDVHLRVKMGKFEQGCKD